MRNFFRRDKLARPSATQRTGAAGSTPLRHLADYKYAAVDVETTGLFPNGHDRIIEVGIVLFSLTGGAYGEYETVFNPHRDVGPQHIHGLSMAELSHAPAFEDVCGELAALLAGRVLVAHNASFDIRFLQAEFRRVTGDAPELPYLCTMRLAAQAGLARRLSAVCSQLGLSQEDPHTAIGDARAAARIFETWYSSDPANIERDLDSCGCTSEPASAPHMAPTLSVALPRSEASRQAAASRGYLATLLDNLGTSSDATSAGEAEYLDLLDRALEDRHLTQDEAEGLVSTALRQGLSKPAIERLHHDFFQVLTAQAWADEVVSTVEADDLHLVGEFLGLDAESVRGAIASPPLTLASKRVATPNDPSRLPPGTTICFTGELHATILGRPISRDQATALAARAGLVVLKSVTKKLDVLIVADPQSNSGKAKQARKYGIRIIAEAVFWQSIEAGTD